MEFFITRSEPTRGCEADKSMRGNAQVRFTHTAALSGPVHSFFLAYDSFMTWLGGEVICFVIQQHWNLVAGSLSVSQKAFSCCSCECKL